MSINALNIIPVRTASCSVMGDYALKKKMTVAWSKKKVGDVVLYDFNHNGTSDHTGIIVHINSNGTIDVVEGNTSEKSDDNGGNVMRRTRSKSQVNYIVRPKYDDKVTANMIVATAVSQLDIKEVPSGSNKVKYNTWYYGKIVQGRAYPWCMTFVEWCFAHVLEQISKPTGKYNGAIPVPTVQRNSKGNNVKTLQNFLNWYHPAWNLLVDGVCGEKTLTAIVLYQMAEKLLIDGVFGSASANRANTYKASSSTPVAPVQPTPAPAPIPTTDKVIGKCIDVSYWQNRISTDSWKKIKNTCEYAICRASYTSLGKFSLNKDSTFDTNVKNAKSAGLKVGAYHFSQALSVAEAQKEANYLCDILDQYGVNFWVACDYETNKKGRLNSKTVSSKASEIANAFCAVVEKRGYKACIYANYVMLRDYLKAPEYPVWLSQYNDTCSYKGKKVMWQYTSKGRVDGITAKSTNNDSADVDLSYVYSEPQYPQKEEPKPEEPKDDAPSLEKPTRQYVGLVLKGTLKKGMNHAYVGFLQRFLNWYGNFGLSVDNDFGEKTETALKAFQETEGIVPDGIYGSVSYAKANAYRNKTHSYKIEVDLVNQITTVYDNGIAIISEFVSTARKGKTTPVGNWKIQGASGGRKAKYRTCKLSGGKTYAEYACRFTGAKMMHGVPWKTRNTDGHVYKGEFDKLGSVASAGCVRMPNVLAKFIYEECPIGTPVKVFKGTKGKYPMGKPFKYKATSNIDPTYKV